MFGWVGQPSLWALFSTAICQNPKFCPRIFIASLSGFWKGKIQPSHFKTLGGDIFGINPLLGPGPDPVGPRVWYWVPQSILWQFVPWVKRYTPFLRPHTDKPSHAHVLQNFYFSTTPWITVEIWSPFRNFIGAWISYCKPYRRLYMSQSNIVNLLVRTQRHSKQKIYFLNCKFVAKSL